MISFRRITDTQDPMWPKAWQLCLDSFPACERRDMESHIKAMMSDPEFYCCAVRDETQQFVGIIFFWIYNDQYLFIEHLAVDNSIRSGGWGTLILDACKCLHHECLILLEIEPPVDELTIRREKFYLRSGFVLNPHEHIHPSFDEPRHPHPLMIMSYPRMMTEAEFTAFRRYTFNHILQYSKLQLTADETI